MNVEEVQSVPLTPLTGRRQAAIGAQLLQELTGAMYVFNGTALALEQSHDTTPPTPELLEKLYALAHATLIDFEQRDDTLTITSLDLKKLETYAAKDVIEGIEAVSDVHFSLPESEAEQEDYELSRRRLHYKGPVTPSQLARLYRLQVKHDLSIQLIENAEEERELAAEISINAVDRDVLAKDRNAEAARRADGQEVADLMTTVTGKSWNWNGLDVVLSTPLDQLNTAFYAQLKTLADAHIATHMMQRYLAADGQVIYGGCHLCEVDMAKLRATAEPILDEATALLNQMFENACAENTVWNRDGGSKIIRYMPVPTETSIAGETRLAKEISQLRDHGVLRVSNPLGNVPHAPSGSFEVRAVQIDRLREAAQQKQASPQAPLYPTDAMSWTERMQLAPVSTGFDLKH